MTLLMGVTLSSVQTSALNRSSRLVYTQLFAVNYATLSPWPDIRLRE